MEPEKQKLSLNDFTLLSIIGKGSYAKVVLVREKAKQKRFYAMKIIKKKYIENKKQQKTVKIQRDILKQVKHPFIIELHSYFQDQKKLFFALQFCPGGDLYGLIAKNFRFIEQQAKFYAAQIILGLQYLHTKDIIYRDLKPQNILLDKNGYIKLTDFGLSKVKQHDQKPNAKCGTPEYFAPEILYQEVQGKSVDWWCLGCIIYEMVAGLPPFFEIGNQKELFRKIKYQNPQISPKLFSKSLIHLLQGLLQKKPQIRLGTNGGAQQIKQHPWFQNLDWNSLILKKIKPPFPIKFSQQNQIDLRYFKEWQKQPVISPNSSQVISDDGKVYSDFSFERSCQEKIQFEPENGDTKFQLMIQQQQEKKQ